MSDVIINHKTSYTRTTTNEHTIDADGFFIRDYMNYDPLNKPKFGLGRVSGERYDKERSILGQQLSEYVNMYGFTVNFYDVTYNKNYDRIWGEDGDRTITSETPMKAYYDLNSIQDVFIWDKWGMDNMNDFSIFIPKAIFEFNATQSRPQTGDLVWLTQHRELYSIVDVKDTSTLFLMSKQYIWEIVLSKATIEPNAALSDDLQDSVIAKFFNTDDIFDISKDVETLVDPIIYNPIDGEKASEDPFASY